MPKKVFTSQKVSIFLAGQELRIQALVSIYGIKYVFDEEDFPTEARATVGSEVQVSYKGILIRCRFVRETNAAGTIYNLRFLNPSSLLLRQVEKDIETSGIPSPWIRGLPRLSTEVKKLPMPVVAAVSYADGAHYMNIKNFTLGGLLLEHNGNEVSDLSVASRIELELVTNGGEKLGQMVGSVTHISAEINDVNPSASRYQIGLKFVSMPAAIELRYRGLIREHCQALKSELGADADVG